jgi:hypothetical protein
MRRWLLLLAFLTLSPSPGHTQSPLVTDRPDFTESAETVGPRRVQVEAGYTFTRSEEVDEHALGEVLVRIGILDRLELRAGLNSYAWLDGPDGNDSGYEDPSLGAKIALALPPDRPGWRPAAAILVGTTVPGVGDLGEDAWQPEAKLALGWDLSESVSLGSNAGYAHSSEEGEEFDQAIASLALGFDIAGPASGYVEAFGFAPAAPDGDDAAIANGGVTWLLNPDLQLDARLGAGLNRAAPDLFVGVGIARRW